MIACRSIQVGMAVHVLWRWRKLVLDLMRDPRSQPSRLTRGSVQHWLIPPIPAILFIFFRLFLNVEGSSHMRTVNYRSGDERNLRGDGQEQTLLVRARTILTSSVGRAVKTGAANLMSLQYGLSSPFMADGHTFLLRQCLHAIAARRRGAGAAATGA